MRIRNLRSRRYVLTGVAALAALGISTGAAVSASASSSPSPKPSASANPGSSTSSSPSPSGSERPNPRSTALTPQAAPATPSPSPSSYAALLSSDPSAASTYTTVNQLLNSAAVTEANAYLQYYAYADAADQAGYTDLANVWRTVGQVEHQDHFTHEITLSGFYSGTDNIANLKIAIMQAQQAAKAYKGFAVDSPDCNAADVLRRLAKFETTAADLLTQALNALQGGDGSVPAAPQVEQVPVEVSPAPHYTGTFYNDLTGASDSALAVASWQWAQYQWISKVAVSTGQANLGALLTALELQEAQNYTEISNLAGFVNSIDMNLQESINSEQGAIDMYAAWAPRAQQLGNESIATTFSSIEIDEKGHHQTFTTELEQWRAGN
jgi:rubrerythrin